MNDEPTPPPARPKRDLKNIDKHVDAARRHIVEHAVVGFIEDVDGKAPSDADIEQHVIWGHFSKTPLAIFRKNGIEFVQFFVWKREHALAVGFHDANNILDLQVCRLRPEEWPPALTAYVTQYPNRTTETQ